MRKTIGISEQGEQTIQDFIHALTTHEDLNPKTLKEYASDMKHFISWFETAGHQEEEVIFRIADVATPTLSRYREASQKVMELKPATINWRLITLKRFLKRFFDWAVSESTIRRDPSKPVKLVPEGKVSPRHMTDKEETALIAAAEHGGIRRFLS